MLAAEIDTVIPDLATGYLGDDDAGLPPRRARLSAGRRRRPHLDGRGPADLGRGTSTSRSSSRRPAGAARGVEPAHRRPRQPLPARRRRRRAARAGDDRPWRPVAGLPHRVPARARGRPHGRGDRQSRQRSIRGAWRARSRPRRSRATACCKPAPEPIAAAEIEPIAGTWFNAEEPSLFDLAWKNGEADGDAERPALRARAARADGWLAAERGSFEFALKPAADGAAGRSRRRPRAHASRSSASARPCRPAIAGTYVSADSGATWQCDGAATTTRSASAGR